MSEYVCTGETLTGECVLCIVYCVLSTLGYRNSNNFCYSCAHVCVRVLDTLVYIYMQHAVRVLHVPGYVKLHVMYEV